MQSFNKFLLIALAFLLFGFAIDYIFFTPDKVIFERRAELYDYLENNKTEASGCVTLPDNKETSLAIIGNIIHSYNYEPEASLENRYILNTEEKNALEHEVLKELDNKCEEIVARYKSQYHSFQKINKEIALWRSPLYFRAFVEEPQESLIEEYNREDLNPDSYHFQDLRNTETVIDEIVSSYY